MTRTKPANPSYQSVREAVAEADAPRPVALADPAKSNLSAIINPGPSAIERVEDALATMEEGSATPDQVRAALSFKQQLYEVYRSITFRFDLAMVAWIEKNGDLEDGMKRYYVGTETKRKCRAVPVAFKALLEKCGGDLDLVLTTLASDAFKPASAMKMLGDDAPKHFESTVEKDVKTGEPKKKVKTFDERYQG